ncbi:mitochondrial outer membrane import complex protein METAXIN [Impatiens glandulifera]|uniref:mitochondrial outer membrane import complex protein METAXIN n=1 Tax=Impatiens glandulifera TaxID=253017 RepID=UPI001FB0ECF0|nr:mitochondrial outer membrane import complex protein METAXIN [Impatiens glandulifera]
MDDTGELTLVARKPSFGLPTSCPQCLPVYIYLKFAKIPFTLSFNLVYPDSDQIPYVESGTNVAYNNEKGGVIEGLKKAGIVDLDSEASALPEWISMTALASSWLGDAIMYDLWLNSDGSSARKIYYDDLPWPIGKILYFKQVNFTKQLLGLTRENSERREEEIYRRAEIAYSSLSTSLGDQQFLFGNRPTSLDAVFLGHALFALHALPETSVLRSKLLEHSNLVNYAEKLKVEFIDNSSPSSSIPPLHTGGGGPSNWSSKPKTKPKKEKTEEEKKFKRRTKYFLVTQLVAVLVFLSLLGGSEVDVDEDDGDDDHDYDD